MSWLVNNPQLDFSAQHHFLHCHVFAISWAGTYTRQSTLDLPALLLVTPPACDCFQMLPRHNASIHSSLEGQRVAMDNLSPEPSFLQAGQGPHSSSSHSSTALTWECLQRAIKNSVEKLLMTPKPVFPLPGTRWESAQMWNNTFRMLKLKFLLRWHVGLKKNSHSGEENIISQLTHLTTGSKWGE